MKVISLSDQSLPQLKDWTEIEVYEDITEVPGSYLEIAVLEITTAVSKTKMVRDSRRRASELGANGIVLERVGTHTDLNHVFIGSVFIPVADKRWDGRILVIRVN